MRKILFISSTGGHLRELMELEPLFKDYDSYIITEKDATTKYLQEKYKDKVSYLPYCTRSKILSYIFLYTFLIIKSIYLFIKIRPEIVVTTGTHTAVPICFLSKFFKRKVIYIETYANRTRRSLTGRIVYPISNLFIVQWKEMLKLYPKAIYVEK